MQYVKALSKEILDLTVRDEVDYDENFEMKKSQNQKNENNENAKHKKVRKCLVFRDELNKSLYLERSKRSKSSVEMSVDNSLDRSVEIGKKGQILIEKMRRTKLYHFQVLKL